MARKPLVRIFNSPDRAASQTHGPNGILSRAFRMIMEQLDVGAEKWGYLMRLYVTDPRNGVAKNRKDQTSVRGNLSAAFSHDRMTWKVFCKALRFFQVRKVRIVWELHMDEGPPRTIITQMELTAPKHAPDDDLTIEDLNTCLDHIVAEATDDEGFDVEYRPRDPEDKDD